MLGLWGTHAQTFLLVMMTATTLVFALPIFLMPLRWARMLGWRIPADTDLAVYFGRCLGAFVLIVEALMLRAGLTGELAVHVSGTRLRGIADGDRAYLGRGAAHSAAAGDAGDRHVLGVSAADTFILAGVMIRS